MLRIEFPLVNGYIISQNRIKVKTVFTNARFMRASHGYFIAIDQ